MLDKINDKDKLIQRRWRRDTLREVYLRDDKLIIKRYWVSPGTTMFPEPWVHEHEALLRLGGNDFPGTYGFSQKFVDGGREVLYARDYVEGKRLNKEKVLSLKTVTKMAYLLARVHGGGVVVDDASRSNFVIDEDNDVRCVDFGRAIVFDCKGPAYYVAIGREFAKFRRECLLDDRETFLNFREEYWRMFLAPQWARILVLLSYYITYFTHRIRKGLLLGSAVAADQDDQLVCCRTRSYARGCFTIYGNSAERRLLEKFIMRQEFLNTDEDDRIPTHNKRYRIYSFVLPGVEKEVIMKVAWANPAYRFMRRLNVILSQLLRDNAGRALKGALALEKADIPTIRPLACWSYRRSPLFVDRYLMYEKIPARCTARDYLLKARQGDKDAAETFTKLVDQMADMVAEMHSKGLRHDDIAPGNFLVMDNPSQSDETDITRGYKLFIIDTDRISVSRMPILAVKRFFDLKYLRRVGLDNKLRRRFFERYMRNESSEAWWRVMEFWRLGGNRPLRTLLRLITKRGVGR